MTRRDLHISDRGASHQPPHASARLLTLTLAAVIVGAFVASPAAAQVTPLDAWAVASSAPGVNAGTVTLAAGQTVSAGTQRLLVVGVVLELSANQTMATLTATLGGTAMTSISSSIGNSRNEHAALFYLPDASIPAGPQSLVIAFDANGGVLVNSLHVYGGSYSLVDQATPITSSRAGNTNTPNVTFGAAVNYVANGRVVYVAGNAGSPATQTPPGGFTQLATSTANGQSSFASQTGVQGAAGNYAGGTTVTFGGTAPANGSAIAVAALAPATADVSITKTAPSPIYFFDTFSYTITVSNAGPSSATNVNVSDTLPAGELFISASPSQGSCSFTSSLSCALGTLASGASATITLTVQARALGALSNTATVAATQPDPNNANNSSTSNSTVLQTSTADVSVTKSGNPASLASGNVAYTIVASNAGPDTATGVVLTDAVPVGTTYVSSSLGSFVNGATGSCSGTSVVSCTLNLPSGASATLTLTVNVTSAGNKVNTATVAVNTSTTFDPNLLNNSASTTTTVTGGTGAPSCPAGSAGAGGTRSGVINRYYPGTSSVTAGVDRCIPVGTAAGAAHTLANGDLLLVVQMQDADIDSTNSSAYGDGTGIGAGALAAKAGTYEYARAAGALGGAGCPAGSIPISGTGPSGALANSYTNSNATAAKGQARFQVIWVPEYSTATLNGVTALPWQTDNSVGATNGLAWGGVLAINVTGVMTVNANAGGIAGAPAAYVDGQGFRGAAGRRLAGDASAVLAGDDWVQLSTYNTNGGKGEGIAGTPAWVFNSAGSKTTCGGANTYVVQTNQPNDGYPGGSMARGAPANAGGGSTDPNPPSNDENSGGGGGSNGGAGGTGGHSWNSNLDRGGHGAAVTPAITKLVMGGGGGAGTRNNDGCAAGEDGATVAQSAQASSGAAGGGLMVLRAGSLNTAAGAILSANGAVAYNDTANDGAGGGGAGGSVIMTVSSGTLAGLTIRANGGTGGSAWSTSAPGGPTPPTGNRHGPGGGGGGGVVVYTNTATPPTLSVAGGAAGITTTANDNFGAQTGATGQSLTATAGDIPGNSVASCTPDPAITLGHNPTTVTAGGAVQIVATVTNVSPFTATNGTTVSVTLTLASGLSFSSASGTGWTCDPPIGNSVTCRRSTVLAPLAAYPPITINAVVSSSVSQPGTLTNTATVSGGGDTNLSNNNATDLIGVRAPTLAHVKVFDAWRRGSAVELRWRTSYEANNLGFRVYRESGGERVLITPSLIAGSALFTADKELRSGRTYAWLDDSGGSLIDPVYWLEDVDLNGTRTLTGPVVPESGAGGGMSSGREAVADSPTLARLGRSLPRGRLRVAEGMGRERRTHLREGRLRKTPAWNAPSLPGAKLFVQQEGWYRVTRAQLAAAGFDPGADASGLQLLVDGAPAALLVNDGGDGSFDPTDSVEFYGVGIDSPYDANHVYWLTSGRRDGLRVTTGPSVGKGLPSAPASFPFDAEWKDRVVFFAALKENANDDNFFGAVVSTELVSHDLLLQHLDTASAADSSLKVTLQGVTNGVQHSVAVQLNGHDLGTLSFADQARSEETFPVSPAWLQEGANPVTLVALGGDDDISVLDSVELTYPHRYAPDSGALRMTAPANTRVSLFGLSDTSLRVINLTDPQHVRELPVRFERQGAEVVGSVSLLDPWGGDAQLYGFTPDRVLSPVAIVANEPSRLRPRRNAVDLVIIAHPSLLSALEPLRAFRQAQGLVTQLVDVTDVYDEFSHGQRTPYAIRDFLSLTEGGWKKPPHYVLLAGDASFDPKNFLGFGEFDLVPTKLVPTAFLMTASDDWFVDFDQDGFPEMAVGRLPARTSAEASLFVSKVLAREQALAVPAVGPDWRSRVMLVADAPGEFDFEAATDRLQAQVAPGFTSDRVSIGPLGWAAHDAIVSGFDTGRLLVNYSGHGSEDIWSGGIFSGSDAVALTNGAQLPFVVVMNCLNGLFYDLYVESLAESLLKAPAGGAAAVWASSALTEPDPQALMNEELFRQLFRGGAVRLGDATVKAKAVVADPDVRRTWILLGDPTMRFR